jgi:hypothetical protein
MNSKKYFLLIFQLLIVWLGFSQSYSGTDYYDRYGNKIGSSTPTNSTNPFQVVKPAEWVAPMDLNLLREGLIYKQRQAQQQLEYERYEAEREEIEKNNKFIRARNEIIDWHNSRTVTSLPDGWYKCWIFQQERVTYGQRQVYISNNKITQYYKDQSVTFIVDYSSDINNGYAKITIRTNTESSTEARLTEIFILN